MDSILLGLKLYIGFVLGKLLLAGILIGIVLFFGILWVLLDKVGTKK